MSLFPLPPAEVDPGTWPEMLLYAATVLLEAEGEPSPGMLAVAFVIKTRMEYASIKTRMEDSRSGIRAVILGRDELAQGDSRPYEAFSCWNDDYVAQRRARLTAPDPEQWELAWRAACAAYWHLLPDPTQRATHYLNEALTRQIRPLHDLPSWYDPDRVTARIGRHAFLRLSA